VSDTVPIDPTTICFKNIPNFYNRAMLLELLDSNGFEGSYDFIYVPHSFKRLPALVSLGYFFVNFASHEVASRAWARLVGFKDWVKHSEKVMDATWAATTQGQEACIERFQNSRVNGASVPVECKPMILEIATIQNNSQVKTVEDEANNEPMCRLNTFDFFDLGTGVDSDAEGCKVSSASSSTTDEPMDSEADATLSDAADEASESDPGSACFNATATWPVSRRQVRWCDVTDDESDGEMSPMSPQRQKKGLALTFLQSASEERGTEKSFSVKNTFIELDESPIAARRTRFASSFM